MICKCPAGAALPDVPRNYVFGKFRTGSESGFSTSYERRRKQKQFYEWKSDYGVSVGWTPLLSAADSTKIVVSPYIQAPTAEAGAARTFGGGNETLGGVEEIIGRTNPVYRSYPQSPRRRLSRH